MRPSFLDHLPAAQARSGSRGSRNSGCARALCRARVISHRMSPRYVLEHPVEDPEEDEDDEFDEDDDGEDDEDDEDEGEEEVETWQCRVGRRSAKATSLLDFRR